jgi:hypothetical protein
MIPRELQKSLGFTCNQSTSKEQHKTLIISNKVYILLNHYACSITQDAKLAKLFTKVQKVILYRVKTAFLGPFQAVHSVVHNMFYFMDPVCMT